MLYQNRSGKKILCSILFIGANGDAEFGMDFEKDNVKMAFSLVNGSEEVFDDVYSVQQLESWREVELLVGESVKKKRVSLDQEELCTSVITDEVDCTRGELVVPCLVQ